MKKWTLVIILAVLICGLAIFSLLPAGRPMSAGSEQRVTVSQFLGELGRDYDRFFTIEEAWKQGEAMNALESQLVQRSSAGKDLTARLEQLHRSVPNLTFRSSESNSRIVHIIDARLAQQNTYALESVIKHIDFTGPVDDLVRAVAQQGISVTPQSTMFLNEFKDYSTVAHLQGNNIKVRDALSNSISLRRGSRILWIARTKIGQKEVTRIYYPSPGANQ